MNKRNMFSKTIGIIFVFILFCTESLMAKEVKYTPKDVDIIFVIDSSYSMKTNDKNKIAEDMIKMFIDTLPTRNVRVGYVAYNQGITAFSEPMRLSTYEQRNKIKENIGNIKKSGYSDIGLGLKKGIELNTLSSKQNTQSIMILLSDGEIALSQYSDRTKEDSRKDINNVIEQANKSDLPIYTIDLGEASEAANLLEKISSETGGELYTTNNYHELIEIFSEIIKNYVSATIKPVVATMGTGEKQEIKIPIKDSFVKELNVLFVSSSPVDEPKIFYVGDDVFFTKSKYYFSAKIINPPKQEITLEFVGKQNEFIKVYLLSDYDISLILDVPDVIYKNKPFSIDAYIQENTKNEMIKDSEFYQQIIPEIKLLNDNEIVKLPTKIMEDKIQINKTLNRSGEFVLDTSVTHENFQMKFKGCQFEVENNRPVGVFISEINVPTMRKIKSYDLNDYFNDSNGDLLKYEIVNVDNDFKSVEIRNSELIINNSKENKTSFEIKVMDNDGGVIISKPIVINVIPIWQYYYYMTSCIILLLIGGIIILFRYRKNSRPIMTFNGKINGYFIRLKNDEELPFITVPLYQFDGEKRINLKEILSYANGDYVFQGTSQIYFEPGIEKSVILCNKSEATVMIDSDIARKNVKYTLNYKAIIYITLEDELSEIELHYNKYIPSS